MADDREYKQLLIDTYKADLKELRAQSARMAAALENAITVMEDVVRFRHLSDFTGPKRWGTLDTAIAQARAARAAFGETEEAKR